MNKIKILLSLFVILSFNSFGQFDKSPSKSQLEYISTISVSIGGSFIANGSYPAFLNERLDQYITRIYSQAILNYNPDVPRARSQSNFRSFDVEGNLNNPLEFALRGIKLRRANGQEMMLDLSKYRLNGDFKNNPYLQNDDIIIFPVLDLERNFIAIDGAINKPGRFQFLEGDRLSDILELAMGINHSYENVDLVRISRLSFSGDSEQLLEFKIQDNPILQRGDRINILAEETQKKDFKVYIVGEVHNPGFVNITRNNTSIREVFKRAGGFKPNADLNRTELVRGTNVFRSVLFTEEFENMMMLRMAKIEEEDSMSFIIDNKLRFTRGNGLINFNEVMNESSPEGDFVVRDGDVIFIPEKLNLVYVFGQVKKPGYIKHAVDQDYNYYISKAGGLGDLAREEVYIIKGQSRTWIEIDEDVKTSIEPGDFIWIPKEIPRNFTYYLNRIMAVSSVIGSVATIILIFLQTSK
ncbi:MAG: SLBB domain-containing protein [Ignavibacteriaceae bacterium]